MDINIREMNITTYRRHEGNQRKIPNDVNS